ncbi:cyclic lactone autoinducer peptide [Clostridium fermenticellae]|uniref:Cyclic lactone autoinducer peptide n=1 Tax=Clostridium fermenticellae TaxID=2068654 RepID=A0A386H1X7_9CLOT|nr:cyclic lactone autoinducer peptide [Clostridium fermenticellae]AYD39664.1 cyclic lactone autoinducer peptide [Clostridium fermenticellae]
MKSFKKYFLKKSMKLIGSVALLLGGIVMTPTSLISGHQPKCPDEFLK